MILLIVLLLLSYQTIPSCSFKKFIDNNNVLPIHDRGAILRVSGTGFARLRGPHDTYALLLNKGRLTRDGDRILSPIGGGFDLLPGGKQYLEKLGAEHFEGHDHNELRCQVPDAQIPRVIAWFERRHQRETTVWRELMEELVEETGILTLSGLRDGYVERYACGRRHEARTTRNVPNKQTTYLMETFDVGVGPNTLRTLWTASQRPIERRWMYFVTADEIASGRTKDGVKIGQISQFVL